MHCSARVQVRREPLTASKTVQLHSFSFSSSQPAQRTGGLSSSVTRMWSWSSKYVFKSASGDFVSTVRSSLFETWSIIAKIVYVVKHIVLNFRSSHVFQWIIINFKSTDFNILSSKLQIYGRLSFRRWHMFLSRDQLLTQFLLLSSVDCRWMHRCKL